jgi:hypothetical protein
MMMAIADALESECIDRVIPELDEFNRPIPRRRYCSEALLIRLLDIFHPEGGPKRMTMNPGIRGRVLKAPCTREESFKSRRQRVAYHHWERQQAIALAMHLLLNPPPQPPPPTIPPRPKTPVSAKTPPIPVDGALHRTATESRSENLHFSHVASLEAYHSAACQNTPPGSSRAHSSTSDSTPITTPPTTECAPSAASFPMPLGERHPPENATSSPKAPTLNSEPTPKKPNPIRARLLAIANRSKRPAPPVHNLHHSKTSTPAATSEPIAKCTIIPVSAKAELPPPKTPAPTVLSNQIPAATALVEPPLPSAICDLLSPTPTHPPILETQIRPPDLNLDPPQDFQPVFVGAESFKLRDLDKIIAAKLSKTLSLSKGAAKAKSSAPPSDSSTSHVSPLTSHDSDLPSLQKALDSLALDSAKRKTSHDPSPPRAAPDTS